MTHVASTRPDVRHGHADRARPAPRRPAAVRLPLDLPGVDDAPRGPARDGRPARGLRDPAADDHRGAAARRGRRLDRRRQVDAGQLAGRRAGDRARRAAPDDPVAGARPPPRRRHVVRPGPAAARPRAGRPASTNDPGPSQLVPSDAVPPGPGHPRRPRRRLGRGAQPARSPPSCWPRPTSGCSSRPRPATPTRCRGTSCGRPPSARPRSRSSSTAPRAEAVADGLHPPGPDAGQPRAQGLAAVRGPRGPGRRRRAAAGRVRRRDPRPGSRSLAADADARGAVVRQTLDGAVRTLAMRTLPGGGRGRRPGRDRRSGCARTPTTAYDDAVAPWSTRDRRRHAAARRGARPLAGVRRDRRAAARSSRPRSAGSATGSSTPVKGKPQQAERVTVAVESGLETLHPRARRGRGRARRGLVAAARGRPGAARRRRAATSAARPVTCAAVPSGRSGTGSGRAGDGPHARAPTSARPPGSWRSASTGSRSR